MSCLPPPVLDLLCSSLTSCFSYDVPQHDSYGNIEADDDEGREDEGENGSVHVVA